MTTAASDNKRGFDAPRGNLWSFDPFELSIVGGKRLPAAEQGPLDTGDNGTHDLYDERLDEELPEEFINSIDAYGVDTPILITRLNGVATVVAGRKRVRAARIVCARRKKAGEPPVKVDCKLKRTSGAGLLGAMITENEARTNDGFLTKLAKLKRLMDRGVSIEDAAVRFNVTVAAVNAWLAYEDNATEETKAAAQAGRLSASAAAELAKITDPVLQNEKLNELISSGEKTSARTARAASRVARGKGAGVADKRTQQRFLKTLQSAAHPNISEKTAAFWEGAEEMLKLVMGMKDVDQRLCDKLEETRETTKEEKKAKAKKLAVRAAKKAAKAKAEQSTDSD